MSAWSRVRDTPHHRSAVDADFFVSVPQAARELGVSKAAIARRARIRGIHPIRTPGHFRYFKRADLRLLQGHGHLKAWGQE